MRISRVLLVLLVGGLVLVGSAGAGAANRWTVVSSQNSVLRSSTQSSLAAIIDGEGISDSFRFSIRNRSGAVSGAWSFRCYRASAEKGGEEELVNKTGLVAAPGKKWVRRVVSTQSTSLGKDAVCELDLAAANSDAAKAKVSLRIEKSR